MTTREMTMFWTAGFDMLWEADRERRRRSGRRQSARRTE
jgi:hypothetical protein